jgi:hypothetical protein
MRGVKGGKEMQCKNCNAEMFVLNLKLKTGLELADYPKYYISVKDKLLLITGYKRGSDKQRYAVCPNCGAVIRMG